MHSSQRQIRISVTVLLRYYDQWSAIESKFPITENQVIMILLYLV